MAYIKQFECKICGDNKTETGTDHNICASCQMKKAKIAKDAFMEEKKLMPLEKRVALIEEMLYDTDINSRLQFMESQFITY